jgi:zinc transport system ATP-binding protein
MNDENEGHRPVAVRFDDVSFSYGSLAVLELARFHIHRGEYAALVGPNGSGKTTILRLILGLARPSSGAVTVLGKRPDEARESLGYVPQGASFDSAFPISVEEVVRMGRLRRSSRRFGREDAEAVEHALGAAAVADLRRRPYAALSGGQRRRVLVARALASRPELLVLDEPTANMDAESEDRLFAALAALRGRTTILVVTHDTGFVSSQTDAVFCVGAHGKGKGVHKHLSLPAVHVDGGKYGGAALQVLHDTELPEDACFEEEARR